jgi:hypothetical protein|tara:strand:+ start:885 stop:1502 length:618 start_codon:yes stop_codon:yes gene_type:complete
MYEQSEQVNELHKALADAQRHLGRADKDGKNPHYRSRYATLTSVIEAVRPVFAVHGLSIQQHPHYADGIVSLTTILGHSSGQWSRSVASVPIGKKGDSHALGSCISYLRRYSLAAVACLVQDDDDGNAAAKQQATRRALPSTQAAAARIAQELEEAGLTVEQFNTWAVDSNRATLDKMSPGQRQKCLDWLEHSGGLNVIKSHTTP